jgi:hypothetical protein
VTTAPVFSAPDFFLVSGFTAKQQRSPFAPSCPARYCARHLISMLVCAPCLRAISLTAAPVRSTSCTIRAFSPTDHFRRPRFPAAPTRRPPPSVLILAICATPYVLATTGSSSSSREAPIHGPRPHGYPPDEPRHLAPTLNESAPLARITSRSRSHSSLQRAGTGTGNTILCGISRYPPGHSRRSIRFPSRRLSPWNARVNQPDLSRDVTNAGKAPAADGLATQVPEPALDQIQPTGAGGNFFNPATDLVPVRPRRVQGTRWL